MGIWHSHDNYLYSQWKCLMPTNLSPLQQNLDEPLRCNCSLTFCFAFSWLKWLQYSINFNNDFPRYGSWKLTFDFSHIPSMLLPHMALLSCSFLNCSKSWGCMVDLSHMPAEQNKLSHCTSDNQTAEDRKNYCMASADGPLLQRI